MLDQISGYIVFMSGCYIKLCDILVIYKTLAYQKSKDLMTYQQRLAKLVVGYKRQLTPCL